MADTGAHDAKLVVTCEADGVIRISGRGLWSDDLIQSHFREIKGLISERQSQKRAVLVLIDLSGGIVQSSAIANSFGAAATGMHTKGDKVAIVVSSVLMKMQIDRVSKDHDYYKIFQTKQEAEAWLSSKVS